MLPPARWWTPLAGLLLFASALRLLLAPPAGPGGDFHHFWAAARFARVRPEAARTVYRDRAGVAAFLRAELHDRAVRQLPAPGEAGLAERLIEQDPDLALEARLARDYESGFGFVNTPVIVGLVRALGLDRLPFPRALLLWRILQVAAFGAALLFLTRLGELGRPASLLALALGLVSGPFLSSLRVGQFLEVTLLLAAAGLLLAARGRPAIGGLLLGAALALKPLALPFLAAAALSALVRRRGRGVLPAAALLGCAAALAAGEAALPGGTREFARGLVSLTRGTRAAGSALEVLESPGNRAPLAALCRLGAPAAPAQLALGGTALLALLAAALRGRSRLAARPLEGAGLATLLLFLPSGLVWFHYYELTAPALIAAPVPVAVVAWAGIAFSELLSARLPAFLFPEVAALLLLLVALLARATTDRARDQGPAPGEEA